MAFEVVPIGKRSVSEDDDATKPKAIAIVAEVPQITASHVDLVGNSVSAESLNEVSDLIEEVGTIFLARHRAFVQNFKCCRHF